MSAAARARSSSRLPLGTTVGGRFRIEAHLKSEAGTEIYRATDAAASALAVLRLVPDAPPQVRAALEADVGQVARLEHRNLVAIRGLGDYAGQLFVAAEAEE